MKIPKEKTYKAKKSLGLKPEHRFARAKKALGQNFLKSTDALRKIISAGEITKGDTILEIGPGKGALTEKILEAGGNVVAIEKDYELFTYLQDKFKTQIVSRSLVLVHDDILKFETKDYQLKNKSYKIIANIPYNITGAIFKKFLTDANQPERMVLMVQHEVGKRIMARDKKESILSTSVKAYGEPSMITKVPARYFSPAPKVDSAVIAIKNISREVFLKNNIDEELFWELVRAGFAHKRKFLLGNLKSYAKKTDWETIFVKNNLKKDIRAENLTISNWVELSKGQIASI